MKIIGLDISTKTGWAVGDLSAYKTGTIHYPPNKEQIGFERWYQYTADLSLILAQEKPDIAIVENYGFANHFTLGTLTTIGTLLRQCLDIAAVPWIEIPPKSLKLFMTGKGNADKKAMIECVGSKFNFKTKDDNQADAFSLMIMGHYLFDTNFKSQIDTDYRRKAALSYTSKKK